MTGRREIKMSETNNKRVKLSIVGDVQGVFFRHFAKKEADLLELTGWCRNESDGSVFAIIEGVDKNVDKFVRWAREGSELATVEEIDVTEEKFTGLEKEFEIR
jgi:acylphosphatase